MQIRLASTALVAAMITASCTGPADPADVGGTEQASAMPAVRISEFHYDNPGTDAEERIEVSGPAGMDVTGWKIYLYNGNGGATYSPLITLSGAFAATCEGGRGVMVFPALGLQNGAPDGLALVNAANQVVEFLSYEGTFAATNGPANGMTSVDVGVLQTGVAPETSGQSLQRTGTGAWIGPKDQTFGACNDTEPPPPPPVAEVTVTPATTTISQGEGKQLTATAFDAAHQPIAGMTFEWKSNDTSIATVNASGLVTALVPGDAVITATAGGVSGSAAVHVEVPPPPPPPPDTRISELHYDNFGTDENEAVEIEGPAGTDLTGWSVVLYNGDPASRAPYNTRVLEGAIPDTCGGRGVVVVFYPSNGIQNGAPDGVALVNAAGELVELLSYEGTFGAASGPAAGATAKDLGVSQTSATPGETLQRASSGETWASGLTTVGLCNGAAPPSPTGKRISFTGRPTTDPALPVGFQDQLFATELDPNTVVTTFTWATETPGVASVDEDGVLTALAAGTAVVRATAADGTSATYALPTRVGVASTTAVYAGNAAFGEPADADPNDDFIVRHPEYTASYNPLRNTPNWVSYELEATHFGPEDRCDCFTFDPALPESFFRYTTADYTGAGAIAGYGIDRGHLARSFDRTSSSLDNAFTFYFSNIVPQAADLNQGPWAIMENDLGDLARLQNKEVYIIAGVAGNIGTVKNEGRIVIPGSTWKVAVIMPRDRGLADVHDYRDVEVIAVVMPNIPGIRGVPWRSFSTTVDMVEQLSGYDLLAALDDKTEAAVEANVRPPFARVDGPYTSLEGGAVAMSAAASFDPDGPLADTSWDFGDGTTGSGAAPTHTYAQDGDYVVTVTVTDEDGLTDSITTTASVANVAPALADFAGATGLLPGEAYTASGSFTDPGADVWTGSVDYGDGSGVEALALSATAFTLAHTYEVAGSFTVVVHIADDDTETSASQMVTVITAQQAVRDARALVDGLLADGLISASSATSLRAKLAAGLKYLDQGRIADAVDVLTSFVSHVDALVRSGRLSAADADPVRTLIRRVIRSIARA